MCLHNCKNCKNFRKAYVRGKKRPVAVYYCFPTQYEITDWVKKNIYCKDWERKR